MANITQKQMVFYVLYRAKKRGKEYVPTWKFVGEMLIIETGEYVMMSYKCPTRLTELMQENEGLLERRKVKGESGSEYYEYRIKPGTSIRDIKDVALYEFLSSVRSNKTLHV